MNNAIGISCGCNTGAPASAVNGGKTGGGKNSGGGSGMSLRDAWEAHFGIKFYGVDGKVDYHDPANPSPDGPWKPGTPPGFGPLP